MNLNQCEASSWSHLEEILTFPRLSKEVSERVTVCCNGRISSSCEAFQLVLAWNELFGWRTMETVPSYFIHSHRVLKIANAIWKCACILLCNFTQVLSVKCATFTYSSRQEQQLWSFVDLNGWLRVQTHFHRCGIWTLFAKKHFTLGREKTPKNLV